MAASKTFDDAQIGTLTVVKHPKARRVKLTFDKNGQLRATIPKWMPFVTGKNFAVSHQEWIQTHRPSIIRFNNSDTIGRYDTITIENAQSFSVRLIADGIRIKTPSQATTELTDNHQKIVDTCYRSLKRQSLALLEQRLGYFEGAMNTSGKKLRVARTHTRWGSCSSTGTLSFSIFIAQLPDDLIDYIIVHELAHTFHMNHSKEFWQLVEETIPDYKHLQQRLKNYNLRLTINPADQT